MWLRFHGGKGVAVAAGVFSVLTPIATGIAAALFLITVCMTRYVSLASITATVALPPVAWWWGAPPAVVIAAAGTGAASDTVPAARQPVDDEPAAQESPAAEESGESADE